MEEEIWLENTRYEAKKKISYRKEKFSRRNFMVARKRNRMQSSVNTRVDQNSVLCRHIRSDLPRCLGNAVFCVEKEDQKNERRH